MTILTNSEYMTTKTMKTKTRERDEMIKLYTSANCKQCGPVKVALKDAGIEYALMSVDDDYNEFINDCERCEVETTDIVDFVNIRVPAFAGQYLAELESDIVVSDELLIDFGGVTDVRVSMCVRITNSGI